jgi:hypothetical protein
MAHRDRERRPESIEWRWPSEGEQSSGFDRTRKLTGPADRNNVLGLAESDPRCVLLARPGEPSSEELASVV